MKYCKYCGKELADDGFCDCIEAQLERQRKAKEENQFYSNSTEKTQIFPMKKLHLVKITRKRMFLIMMKLLKNL